MKPRSRRRLLFVFGFVGYFAALWLLWPTPFVFPLKLFVVLLHETSHALAALASGGVVDRIVLNADQGGATMVRGGSPFLMLSAGYLGSLAWGLLLIEAGRGRQIVVRVALAALAVIVLVTAVVYVRNPFGLVFALLFGSALVVAARWMPVALQATLLTVLGMTSAMYALLDIRSDILMRPDVESDAHMLATLTGVPTLVWGVLWSAVALFAVFIALRRAWRKA